MSEIFTQQSNEIAHLSKFIIGAIFLFNVMFFQVFDGITVVHSPNEKKMEVIIYKNYPIRKKNYLEFCKLKIQIQSKTTENSF